MIKSEHVKDDLKVLTKAIDEDTATLGNVVKAITLVIKIFLDVRMNQVAIMKKLGCEMRTAPVRTPSKDEETKE